jgi:hypothetical protein
MPTDSEIATAVQELRSFIRRCDRTGVKPGSRAAAYVAIATRALDAYDNSMRSPARDERLRALARETRKQVGQGDQETRRPS